MYVLQPNKKTELLSINVTDINISQIIHLICEKARSDGKFLINYVNVHGYYLSFFDLEYKEVLNQSDVVFCDGFGVKIGAWLLNKKIGERMCPPDWIDVLFERCIEQGISLFFLGDDAHTIEVFQQTVKAKFPELKIAGYHHGFFNKHTEENLSIIEQINLTKADILLVGMGMPLQEKWAFQQKAKLNSKVILSVGGTFRWYAGIEKRGPKIVTDNGFEWLWRLCVQPRKVWRRYIIELPYFFWVVLTKMVKARG